ncbi:MAG: hypothetical protein QOJ55_2334 [Solirubrobacteraceae bacterium]|nr:hypothetical protein [Solirubrobacteraceae bacterium]
MLADIAELTARDADQPEDALDAEQWASTILGMMHAAPLPPGEDVAATFLPGFLSALESLGTRKALAALRALAAVTAPDYATAARTAADRLAASGLREPAWRADLGDARPTAAALMCEAAFDDGVSVMVEFTAPNVETHTIGVYIDHNMGGLVKDVFLAGPLSEVRSQLGRKAPNQVDLAIRDLDLAEARARAEAAFDMLDHTWDPPVNEDVQPMRALIEARLRLLPEGFELPDDYVEVTPKERDALLEDFLSSPEGRRWRGDEDAEDVAQLAIDFGAGYNHGGPLRWSPVVVEIFMTSWLARKVTREPGFFQRIPDVLRDWVKYAGRRQAVPAAPLREAVAAVKAYRDEMLDAVSDPEAWGPAKTFASAALEAGVDLTDRDEVERFIERYNDGLAA